LDMAHGLHIHGLLIGGVDGVIMDGAKTDATKVLLQLLTVEAT